jgi:hypothetical protein
MILFASALRGQDLASEDIKILIMTHERPNNFKYNTIFPNARQIFSIYEYNGQTFLRTGLHEVRELCMIA